MFAKDAQKTANIVAKEIFVFVLKAISMIQLLMNAFMKEKKLLMDLLPMIVLTMDTIAVDQMKSPFQEEDVIVIIKMDLPD